ncbi:hypothetical protein D1Y84_06030 [Acidipila sp. EB88]|nr:hypothetical protein D1Y84_06030 [Acidipila sp. EB88]
MDASLSCGSCAAGAGWVALPAGERLASDGLERLESRLAIFVLPVSSAGQFWGADLGKDRPILSAD